MASTLSCSGVNVRTLSVIHALALVAVLTLVGPTSADQPPNDELDALVTTYFKTADAKERADLAGRIDRATGGSLAKVAAIMIFMVPVTIPTRDAE